MQKGNRLPKLRPHMSSTRSSASDSTALAGAPSPRADQAYSLWLRYCDVPAVPRVDRDGVIAVGAIKSLASIGAPALTPAQQRALELLGPDGFTIRATALDNRAAIVVASAGDTGALYGAFHLLRL